MMIATAIQNHLKRMFFDISKYSRIFASDRTLPDSIF